MFKVTMLPARVGDAIWIEYGPKEAPHRVLIDGGTSPTAADVLNARIKNLGAGAFELLIVTHIDTDHIGGIVSMLRKLSSPKAVKQVWFNGWINLAPETKEFLGPIDGEKLTTLIHDLKLPWNKGFDTDDQAIRTSASGSPLPSKQLPGGLTLTVLSPRRAELDRLRPVWEPAVEAAGLLGSDATEDTDPEPHDAGDLLGNETPEDWAAHDPDDLDDTESNGSSIAVLAEYTEGGVTRSCLLAGDAHGPVLADGVRRLAKERGGDRLVVDAFKLPHHGSVRNVTQELIETVDTGVYMVSTNGGGNYRHPHKGGIARAIIYKARRVSLKFNYPAKPDQSGVWDDDDLRADYDYDTEYGDGTLTVELLP